MHGIEISCHCRLQFDLWFNTWHNWYSAGHSSLSTEGRGGGGGGIQAFIWKGCSPKIKCHISQEKELLKTQTPQKLGNRKFIVFKKWFFRIRVLTYFGGLIIKLMLQFKYRNWMTPKIARTGFPLKNVKTFAQPAQKLTQKSGNPPKTGLYPVWNHSKWIEHTNVTKLWRGWRGQKYTGTMNFSCLYFYPRLDLSLISKVPCVKIQVINQFSVFLLRIPSLHYSAEIGSLKAPGWLKVLGSLKVSLLSHATFETISEFYVQYQNNHWIHLNTIRYLCKISVFIQRSSWTQESEILVGCVPSNTGGTLTCTPLCNLK